jgi:hypothetical protein
MDTAAAFRAATALDIDAPDAERAAIIKVLSRYGARVLRFAASAGIRVVYVRPGEPFSARSAVLRKLNGGAYDSWPFAPAGLFVVAERTAYLKALSPMTIAHEFGHAVDCAFGGGIYFSGSDPRVRDAYNSTSCFMTPYAASGLDEYMAEGFRAYVGVNDPAAPWTPATRQRLREKDPALYGIIRSLLAGLASVPRAA